MQNAVLTKTADALNPRGSTTVVQLEPGRNLDRVLHAERGKPVVCFHNGEPKLRAEWAGVVLQPGDVVSLVPVVAGPVGGLVAAVLVSVAVSVALTFLLAPNVSQSRTEEGDPVYSLRGQRNQTRLGDPIQVPYGRNRLWPSYAAALYTKFENNDQYLFALFCLGQGEYDIEAIQIEDTGIASFPDTEYEVVGPSGTVTLFRNNVETSAEVGGIEMFGSNEPEYPTPDGWVGPFVANAAATDADVIEVDVSFPFGLYRSSNGIKELQVTAEFEYREIDDSGTPVGPGTWSTLATVDVTLATTTPQRFTYAKTGLTPARYEVRGRRTNVANTSQSDRDNIEWTAMRAFLPNTNDYGNVTLLAMKLKATNNLNDQSRNRINVIATRKLRSWDKVGQSWNALAATRSAVWALADAFQADYGGRLADSYLDLDALADLDVVLDAAGLYFDWVFDDKSTVWGAATTIAQAVRGIPVLDGSLIGVVRDTPQTAAVMAFNANNIIRDTFRWEIKLRQLNDYDGLEVEYLDQSTWQRETVLCLIDGESGDNPDSVVMAGVQDRTRAYREGLYRRARQLYSTEQVSFETGLEGRIPSFGDLIAVSHDVPKWGVGAWLVSVSGDGLTLTLSEPVTFEVGETYQVALRKRDGSVAGPYTVTEGATANEVVLGATIPDDYSVGASSEPPLVFFGKTDEWSSLCVVTNVEPDDRDIVRITAQPYDARVHTYDAATPPVLNTVGHPTIPDLPTIDNLMAEWVDTATKTQVRVTWSPSLGAQYYLLQISYDYISWQPVVQLDSTSYIAAVEADLVYVRVAAVNVGQGAWSYSTPLNLFRDAAAAGILDAAGFLILDASN